jgi:UDP-GlcNAc:undecaprenyl-phosphate/decaprenyl-phosphate GlcNAc-1-phosphate transferase
VQAMGTSSCEPAQRPPPRLVEPVGVTHFQGLPAALAAALVSCALSPIVRWLAIRVGAVSYPNRDRWSRNPTPLLGGLAVAAGTAVAVLTFANPSATEFALLAPAFGLGVLGIVDDRFGLGPTAKLVASLAGGAALVYLLSRPALSVPSAPLVVLSVVWFAGVVHAVNIIDNIDGLAAGVSAITAVGTALVLIQYGYGEVAVVLFALAGALAGFLPWNLHPARMFMGDGGSLFVGAVLGGCSLVPWFGGGPTYSLLPVALGVALIVPLGDAAFVSALRWMAGRKATRGGVDHTSHRLVSMGLSERRSVLVLYSVALAAAVVAAWVARSASTALPATALLLIGVVLGAVYLARVPTYDGQDFAALQRIPLGEALRAVLARSHAGQVLLDVVLIAVCYYAAYRLRFSGESLDIFLPSFTASLPVVLVCKLAAHYVSGLYQRSWLTFGMSDLAVAVRAVVVGSTASALAATYLYRFERFSRGVFVIDALLLLLAILGSRLSFRLMAHAAVAQNHRTRRVLICGARERGQLLAREMLANTAWGLKPVGFIDGSASAAQSLLGVRVLGTPDGLGEIVQRLRVDEVVFSGDALDPAEEQKLVRLCDEAGVPVQELVFEIRKRLRDTSGNNAA